MKKHILRLLALLFSFSLIAAACGGNSDNGDSGDSNDSGTEAAESEAEEEREDEGGGLSQDAIEKAVSGDDAEEEVDDDAPIFDRSTLDGIWEEADYNRQVMINEITEKMNAGEWGVGSDNILRGPAGFEADLNNCPADWSNTSGLLDDEIRVGQTTVSSGNLAAYGNISWGWENYWNWINDELGGIGGRELKMIIKDDGYVAAQTIEFVDELIESENIFALHGLGSPNGLAVYDKINSECVPHLFYASGHPAWGDPVNHPWTTSHQMSYLTEAVLWGTWIKSNLADQLPVKVAGLVMDNDFGLAYEKGFEYYAENNPDVVSEYLPVRHDPAAPTLTNEVTTIAAFDPDVFISMTAGNPCLLAIQEVEASGLLERLSAAFTPSVCKAIAAYMAPAGMAADSWWVVGGGVKDSTDPQYTDEPFIAFLNDTLTAGGLDPSISLLATGYFFAYPWTETLRVANELPGGMSRTNVMLAARSIDIYHPLMMDGVAYELDGARDAFAIEGSDFSKFDAVGQTWNIIGDIVDGNGGSPNCPWDKENGGC
jgi:branched-chain amino acid transport system substrate-binding protein|tara:strand:+ start:2736 stop:4361 length:1626 start_codon:yes stop_codon:yes gene_type:complete